MAHIHPLMYCPISYNSYARTSSFVENDRPFQGLDFLPSPSAVQPTPTPSSFQAGPAPTGFSQTISPPLANQNTLAANPVKSSVSLLIKFIQEKLQ